MSSKAFFAHWLKTSREISHSRLARCIRAPNSLSYIDSILILGIEKILFRIVFDGLTSILANIEDLGFDADPVQIACQLAAYVGLAARWQTHKANDRGRICELVSTCLKKRRKKKETNEMQDQRTKVL
jgi:hypothetical protein